MTQFCLVKCCNNHDIDPIKASLPPGGLQSNVAKIFAAGYSLYTIALNDKSFDELCCNAQVSILEGRRLEETKLYFVIKKLLNHKIEFWLWYGSDWNDLDEFSEPEGLLSRIEADLKEPQCELYIHYLPN